MNELFLIGRVGLRGELVWVSFFYCSLDFNLFCWFYLNFNLFWKVNFVIWNFLFRILDFLNFVTSLT